MAVNERLQDFTDTMLSSLDGPAPLPARKSDAIKALKQDLNAINARILAMELAEDARNQVDPAREAEKAILDALDAEPEPKTPKPVSFRA